MSVDYQVGTHPSPHRSDPMMYARVPHQQRTDDLLSSEENSNNRLGQPIHTNIRVCSDIFKDAQKPSILLLPFDNKTAPEPSFYEQQDSHIGVNS